MLNGLASPHTRSMLSFGRLMVRLQPATGVWVAVPPGHSAESNTPPELLFTVKVKLLLPHEQMVPVHTDDTQSPLTAQVLPTAQSTQVGPPQSMSVSSPFLMPSLQVGTVDVVVVLLVEVVVVLDVVVLLLVLVDVVLLVLLVVVELLELVLVDVVLLVELVDEVELEVELVVLVELEVVVVVGATLVLVVVGGGGHVLPTPLRQTSLAPVPAAIGL